MKRHPFAAALLVALVHPVLAQTAKTPPPPTFKMRWGDLAPLITGHRVRMTLPDGARIDGTAVAVEPEAMVVEVRKTSDRSAWPKGRTPVPRAAISQFRLTRRTGSNWRFIGTAIGGTVGSLVGIPVAVIGDTGRAAATGVAIIAVGSALGYLAGRTSDEKSMLIAIER